MSRSPNRPLGDRGKRIALGLLRFAQLTLGLILMLAASFWTGLDSAGLERVSLVRLDLIYSGAETADWLLMVILTATGISLWHARRNSGSSTARVDVVQLLGAIVLTILTLIFLPFLSEFEFLDPSNQCLYEACWPRPYQELLMAAPVLGATFTMGVCALLRRRIPHWTRLAIAPTIYVTLATIQQATWHPIIIPFLNGPPPFGH